MKGLELSVALHSLVSKSFIAAKQADALIFSETQLATIHTRKGVPFQLRYCPALAKKPKDNHASTSASTTAKKPDPFENPQAELLVMEIPQEDPSHVLVLNKYPVIPNHIILATKTSKPQTDVLEQDDLAVAHTCLGAWEADNNTEHDSKPRRLFAFFNSGEHSGASQAHRHLQFLPYEDMVGAQPSKPFEDSSEWHLLVDRMTQPYTAKPDSAILHDPTLPFRHYAMHIPPSPSPTLLHATYLTLYRCAVEAVQTHNQSSTPRPESKDPTTASISYNLAMTTSTMAICPRRREGGPVGEHDEDDVAINGTVLAGTLMVKDEAEWACLRRDPDTLDRLLRTIGFPVVDDDEDGSRDGHWNDNKL